MTTNEKTRGGQEHVQHFLQLRHTKILLMSCLLTAFTACNSRTALFEKISSFHSGIGFNNAIMENDSINPLDVVNIYNGGGAGIGDFNNDGLQDVYFTGNMVPCKLYLNKGDFKFEDITDKAGVEGLGRWARGVAVVDINNDGLADIYVCNTIYKDSLRRRNILYINKGLDKDGIPHFTDMARDYGLDIHVQSTMASFFDYDNDGDLDMYLTVNEAASNNNSSRFGKTNTNARSKSARNMGRLFRNDWDSARKHSFYRDVSQSAGINLDGYGHAATIADINLDGWKDIYVSNDFISENILYINNHDGTFTNKSKEYFKHTSFNAMGQDIADINNDGLADVVELDMSPEDNYRKKMMLATSNYNTYQNFDNYKLQYQYVRNTLQLNQGWRVGENDSTGDPAFSEISFMSGVAQTDWSWTPLITDFNNDSYRDIIVTNGFPKDVSDHDFISYRAGAVVPIPKPELIKQIPQIKLHNYAFLNKGDLTFSDATADWGLTDPTFSNGAAVADFDNNGTMDMVISNINQDVLMYKNTSREKDDSSTHYLQITFKGGTKNLQGLGAWAEVYYDHGKHQVYENNPYRGYLSTVQCMAHFGLGKTAMVDTVIIKWPNGVKQTLRNVKANQVLKVDISNAHEPYFWQKPSVANDALFKEITSAAGITYRHNYFDNIDFNTQTTLPHKLSEYCPALASADVDGNGLDDIIAGGNSDFPAKLLLQQVNGKFIQKDLYPRIANISENCSDEGILVFDANEDNSPDIYIASGGNRNPSQNAGYQDRLYINDGKGNFTLDTAALPVNHTSKLCVKAIDFNGDGKPDLFVSGRLDPWHYPKPVSSFIFRNDSQNGHAKFTDVTNEVAPALKNIGMVCDALFTDFDNDLHPDLILAGEWMPVTFLRNVNGKFINATATSGLSDKSGWWNSIVAGDFRHTGRMDYIVGNVGLNTLYRASNQYPVYITAKDFDNNGGYVPIPSLFLPDEKGTLKEFPANGRDEIIERIPTLKKRFDHYSPFAKATLEEILTPAQQKDALRLKATMLQSCFLQNDGNGKFTMIPLPKEAQLAPLNGMNSDDYDGDGNLDVLIGGNDFGTEVSIGKYDAFNGLLLKGDGRGGFKPLSILQSGIYIPGNAKGMIKLRGTSGKYLVASSENKGPVKLFELNRNIQFIPLKKNDVMAITRIKDGKIKKDEFCYGSSFLSQSSRFMQVNANAESITITDSKGGQRMIVIHEFGKN